jgi:hypothetical protein
MDMKLIDNDEHCTIEFPGLYEIDLSDPELQRELILFGVAVGVPGGQIIFTKNVRLEATKGRNEDA